MQLQRDPLTLVPLAGKVENAAQDSHSVALVPVRRVRGSVFEKFSNLKANLTIANSEKKTRMQTIQQTNYKYENK
jgi:hypothetical protein